MQLAQRMPALKALSAASSLTTFLLHTWCVHPQRWLPLQGRGGLDGLSAVRDGRVVECGCCSDSSPLMNQFQALKYNRRFWHLRQRPSDAQGRDFFWMPRAPFDSVSFLKKK